MDYLFKGPVGQLEATLWVPEGGVTPRAAAVVCHPHPLHGGTKQTSAVFRTARGLQQAGLAVLRFNFRGVGKSEGEHDGGPGEVLDASAALTELEDRFPGLELWGAGFSFGSRTIAALSLEDARIRRLVLVALPVLAYDLSHLREVPDPGLVVMAQRDDFGTRAALQEKLPGLSSRFQVEEVSDVDHFFTGKTHELQEHVRSYAAQHLPA